jgi:hypothetical protein
MLLKTAINILVCIFKIINISPAKCFGFIFVNCYHQLFPTRRSAFLLLLHIFEKITNARLWPAGKRTVFSFWLHQNSNQGSLYFITLRHKMSRSGGGKSRVKKGLGEAIVFGRCWTIIEAKKSNNAMRCHGDALISSHFHLFVAWHGTARFCGVHRPSHWITVLRARGNKLFVM